MKKKTNKTPLMLAEAYGPTSCTFGLALESKLSRSPKAQYGFVPKLSHHGGKNIKNLSYGYMVSGFKFQVSGSKILGFKHSARSLFFSAAQRNGVFSSDEVCVSLQRNCDEFRACARACSRAQSHEIST